MTLHFVLGPLPPHSRKKGKYLFQLVYKGKVLVVWMMLVKVLGVWMMVALAVGLVTGNLKLLEMVKVVVARVLVARVLVVCHIFSFVVPNLNLFLTTAEVTGGVLRLNIQKDYYIKLQSATLYTIL
jgi:hypothetical protein